ncbi:MAG: hypothetical protein ACK52U_17340 [Synechococcaceae cyanobacterium]|jgi:hypothetical protein
MLHTDFPTVSTLVCSVRSVDHGQPTTMKPTDDAVLRDSLRLRMNPPHRERVCAFVRDTGIAVPILCCWHSQGQHQGLQVSTTNRHSEQWSAVDKVAVVIESAGLSGSELGGFCRARGLYPNQVARWRQAAEDADDLRFL